MPTSSTAQPSRPPRAWSLGGTCRAEARTANENQRSVRDHPNGSRPGPVPSARSSAHALAPCTSRNAPEARTSPTLRERPRVNVCLSCPPAPAPTQGAHTHPEAEATGGGEGSAKRSWVGWRAQRAADCLSIAPPRGAQGRSAPEGPPTRNVSTSTGGTGPGRRIEAHAQQFCT